MANTPDYTVNYDDKRLTDVKDEENKVLDQNSQLYGGMIGNTDQYFNNQIQAVKDWGDTQSKIQQQQTDFTIEQINQQKDKSKKDYIKEQSGAYVDWQKQSNQYGVGAEKMASAGLTNTGYSESSQVSMYNTYQNRVATAREVFNQAVLNYNNSIKEAQLQNSAALAEIAYQTLKQTLDLSLQGFQYKNQLLIEQANKELEIKNMYHNQWMDRLNQINTENALAEDIRQYNETMKWKTEQAELDRQHEEDMAKLKHDYDILYLDAKTEDEKEVLAEEYRLACEKLAKEREEKEKLLAYEKSLNSAPLTGGGNSGYYSGPSVDGYIYPTGNVYDVETEYYQGTKNPDAAKYGTFSNGYQPKGISGHGKLTKTGDTIELKTQTLSGKKQTLVQNVWKAADGTKWYWEGRQNKYIKIK